MVRTSPRLAPVKAIAPQVGLTDPFVSVRAARPITPITDIGRDVRELMQSLSDALGTRRGINTARRQAKVEEVVGNEQARQAIGFLNKIPLVGDEAAAVAISNILDKAGIADPKSRFAARSGLGSGFARDAAQTVDIQDFVGPETDGRQGLEKAFNEAKAGALPGALADDEDAQRAFDVTFNALAEQKRAEFRKARKAKDQMDSSESAISKIAYGSPDGAFRGYVHLAVPDLEPEAKAEIIGEMFESFGQTSSSAEGGHPQLETSMDALESAANQMINQNNPEGARVMLTNADEVRLPNGKSFADTRKLPANIVDRLAKLDGEVRRAEEAKESQSGVKGTRVREKMGRFLTTTAANAADGSATPLESARAAIAEALATPEWQKIVLDGEAAGVLPSVITEMIESAPEAGVVRLNKRDSTGIAANDQIQARAAKLAANTGDREGAEAAAAEIIDPVLQAQVLRGLDGAAAVAVALPGSPHDNQLARLDDQIAQFAQQGNVDKVNELQALKVQELTKLANLGPFPGDDDEQKKGAQAAIASLGLDLRSTLDTSQAQLQDNKAASSAFRQGNVYSRSRSDPDGLEEEFGKAVGDGTVTDPNEIAFFEGLISRGREAQARLVRDSQQLVQSTVASMTRAAVAEGVIDAEDEDGRREGIELVTMAAVDTEIAKMRASKMDPAEIAAALVPVVKATSRKVFKEETGSDPVTSKEEEKATELREMRADRLEAGLGSTTDLAGRIGETARVVLGLPPGTDIPESFNQAHVLLGQGIADNDPTPGHEALGNLFLTAGSEEERNASLAMLLSGAVTHQGIGNFRSVQVPIRFTSVDDLTKTLSVMQALGVFTNEDIDRLSTGMAGFVKEPISEVPRTFKIETGDGFLKSSLFVPRRLGIIPFAEQGAVLTLEVPIPKDLVVGGTYTAPLQDTLAGLSTADLEFFKRIMGMDATATDDDVRGEFVLSQKVTRAYLDE